MKSLWHYMAVGASLAAIGTMVISDSVIITGCQNSNRYVPPEHEAYLINLVLELAGGEALAGALLGAGVYVMIRAFYKDKPTAKHSLTPPAPKAPGA